MFWLSNRQHLATPLIAPLRVRAHGTHRIQSSSAASGSGMAFSPQRGVTGWRGGQDLTHRDVRLSRALRQEQAFERVGLVAKGAAEGARSEGAMAGAGETQARPRTFRGMVIPQKPRPPESDECCMSGCAVCVYDLYLTLLETYREELAIMRSTLRAQDVLASTWPEELKDGGDRESSSELDVSMSAFAAMERSLRTGGSVRP